MNFEVLKSQNIRSGIDGGTARKKWESENQKANETECKRFLNVKKKNIKKGFFPRFLKKNETQINFGPRRGK